MGTRNLAIREAVYRKLTEEKREDESFSDVIERMLEKRGSLLPLWGALAYNKGFAHAQGEIVEIRRGAKVRTSTSSHSGRSRHGNFK
jgi:predicted CopG family antitoxin